MFVFSLERNSTNLPFLIGRLMEVNHFHLFGEKGKIVCVSYSFLQYSIHEIMTDGRNLEKICWKLEENLGFVSSWKMNTYVRVIT